MALNPPADLTRTVSLLVLAAFAAVAVWLFAPSGGGVFGSGTSGGNNNALPASLRVDGEVQVASQGDVVTKLIVPLTLRGNESIDLGGNFRLRAETAMAETAAASVPATYTLEWLDGNGDSFLDPGECALMTVDLPEVSSVHPQNPLRLVLKPAAGVGLIIEDVLP